MAKEQRKAEAKARQLAAVRQHKVARRRDLRREQREAWPKPEKPRTARVSWAKPRRALLRPQLCDRQKRDASSAWNCVGPSVNYESCIA